MQTFFKRKYVKIPIVSLVLCSLLLQFVPSITPARAWNPADMLKRIFSMIQVPSELELTDTGGFKFGNDKVNYLSRLNCLFKKNEYTVEVERDNVMKTETRVDLKFCGCNSSLKCGWRDRGCRNDEGNLENLMPDESEDGMEECINPFSTFRFGHHESQVELIDEKGYLTIPSPKTPLKCQLKIPLPDEDDTMSTEEKLAERKACNYFRRVQQSAAQIAYTAKKIFNNTDPLSECFFLRNCKTSCSLRFGKVGYTITLLDIIRLFVGDATVVLNVVQKMVNVIKIFRKLVEIADKFKALLDQGTGIISELFDSVRNIYTLGTSLNNLGLKISDAFLFSIPKDIITGEDTLRVEKGYNGFVQLITDFAGNLEKYQSAKVEALALTDTTIADANSVMEEKNEKAEVLGFKNEPEIGFLFVKKNTSETKDNYQNKLKLDNIIADYQTMFNPVSALIDRIALIGEDFDGQSFSLLREGTEDEWWEKSRDKYKEFCSSPDGVWSDRTDSGEVCNIFKYGEYIRGAIQQSRDDLINLMAKWMKDDVSGRSAPEKGTLFWVGDNLVTVQGFPFITETLGLTTGDVVFDEEYFKEFCDTNACWHRDTEREKKPTDRFCDIYNFTGDRVESETASYSFALGSYLIDPDYIRGVVYESLGPSNFKLTYKDDFWRVYWENLARYCIGSDDVDDIISGRTGLKSMKGKHLTMVSVCKNMTGWDQMKKIREMDYDYIEYVGGNKKAVNFSKGTTSQIWDDDAGAWVDVSTAVVDVDKVESAIQKYENYTGTPFSLGEKTETTPWFETFKDTFRDINGIKAVFNLTVPNYIRNVVAESLDGFNCKTDDNSYVVFCEDLKMDTLNYTKAEWLRYWEDLGKAILTENAIKGIMKMDEEDRIEELQEAVTNRYDFLGGISDLENVGFKKGEKDGFKKGDGFDDSSFKNIFSNYEIAFKSGFNLRIDELAKIEVIKQNIDKLTQQDEELRSGLAEGEESDASTYWQSKMWCNGNGSIHPEDQFIGSYEGNVALGNEWERRIKLAGESIYDLDAIKGALEYNLGPNQPLLVYYIEKAKEKLVEYSVSFEAAIDDVLSEIQEEIDEHCKDVDTVCSRSVKNQGEYVDYCTWLDNYKCYRDGSGNNCSDLPITPTCESWIGSCTTCEQCGENAYDNARGTCKRVTGDVWYECDGKGYYSSKSRCERKCPDGDCDREREYDYQCRLSGHRYNRDEFGSRNSCRRRCRWSSCTSNSNCEDRECSANNEACELEDRYEEKYEEELARLQAECARRKAYFKYIDESDELDIDFEPIIENFEENFEFLKLKVRELQYIWDKPIDIQRESAVASSIVHKVLLTIELSKRIIYDTIPAIEEDLMKLSVIDDAEAYLNIGYCGHPEPCTEEEARAFRCPTGTYGPSCEKVSNKTWNRFLFNDEDDPDRSGIIIKLRREVEDAKQQVLEFIKKRTGRYPAYNASNSCPDNIDTLGFLNRILCFEREDINRVFLQLPYFIDVVESFENTLFALDELKDNIMDLEPKLDLELLQSDKSLMEKVKENPITLLSDIFDNIKDIFGDISLNSITFRANDNYYLNKAWGRIGYRDVFGKGGDPRENKYQKAIENLHRENLADLKQLIFMKDDVNMGCNALSLVLNSNPAETMENCSVRENNLIGNNNLQQQCLNLEGVDLRLFDRQEEREELQEEKQRIESLRENVRDIVCEDPSLNTHISCPEWICEGLGDPYCIENASRRVGSAIGGTWPPRDPCDNIGHADGYSIAQEKCITTQKRLQELKSVLGENNDLDWVTPELISQCDTLAIQKSMEKECTHFDMISKYVFEDDCDVLRKCTPEESRDYYKGLLVPPCEEYCESIKIKTWNSFCKVSDEAKAKGLEPVLGCRKSVGLGIRDAYIPNLTLPENNEQRLAVIERCVTASHNIEGPLDEIMKIFSILLGIKSATGLYSGVQVLKSSTQKIIADVTDFVKTIKGDGTDAYPGIIKEFQDLWNSEGDIDLGAQGGFTIDPIMCESHPAVSYSTSKDEKLTSNLGGPVCRGIGDLFQQIEGQFALVRQNTRNIDLVRKGVKEGGLSIGNLKLHLWDEYVPIYSSFDDLKTAADDIKKASSYVWALANAVNFANEQCNCGESYCKFPLCVSGLPLAFAPVKNPYCYMVWIFRHPMEKVARRLGNLLEQQIR